MKIFQEVESDLNEIEVLLDLTFGAGRHALSSYRYREGISSISQLCLVLRDEFKIIVGIIRFWPVLMGYQRLPGLILGPLGIHPTRQGEGLGEVLISEGLKRAHKMGWSRVVLVGDESYYNRFGFSKNIAKHIYFNNNSRSDRLLGCELSIGSMHNLEGPIYNFSS